MITPSVAVEATLKVFALACLATTFVASFPSSGFAQAPLRRPGQCVETHISEIGFRLGTPESGTFISYANDIYGVSYDSIRGIRRSRVGDPVWLCLTSIPRGCPKGDNRGKIYSAQNLRTGARWELPDSQHMCGGA